MAGRIWQNMAEYGRIWQNMAEYGRIWQNMAEYGRQNLVEYYGWQNTVEYGKIRQRYKYKRRTASICGSYEPNNCYN